MRLYRHIKFWMLIGLGCFGIYHEAQFAAIALFTLAGFQPVIEKAWRALPEDMR